MDPPTRSDVCSRLSISCGGPPISLAVGLQFLPVNRWAGGGTRAPRTERRLRMTLQSRILTGVIGLSMLVTANACGTATGAAAACGSRAAVIGGNRDWRRPGAV